VPSYFLNTKVDCLCNNLIRETKHRVFVSIRTYIYHTSCITQQSQMEVGIPQSISALGKSFNTTSRLTIDAMPSSILDVKLASQTKQLVELDLYNDKDDEGEIMLLAMILLQLHGVKLPTETEDENDLLNKKKRQRTSPDQLAILEQIFQTDKMPNQQTRVQLADQLGMSSRRVQIWFQNKRAKVKRSVSKHDADCASPNSLNTSSSSIASPSSPGSSDESPILSPSSPAVVTIQPPPLQLDALGISAATITELAASIVFPTTATPSTPITPSPVDTAAQLKLQLQFSRPSPFIEKQPLLAASY
jgi:hypothetical protein